MKVQAKQLSREARIETLDALYTAASGVHGRDGMKRFLRDLLTESERVMLGRRILIARRLLEGAPGTSIRESMKVGPDTVYRVQRWLEDQVPGYEDAIREMKKEFEKRRGGKSSATGTLSVLKKKYPLHFLLFSTPKSK